MASASSAPTNLRSLATSGGTSFLITGAIGRLPASVLQLGLLLYVTAAGMDFALGGLTVAAVGVGTAIGAPIVGRLIDLRGGAMVVAGAMVVQTIGLLGLAVAVTQHLNPILVLSAAALTGAANPQIGPIARARWSTLARREGNPDLIRVAMGYEGACDEASFVAGPVLAGLLVGVLGANLALVAMVALIWLGEGIFLAYLIANRSSVDVGALQPENASGGWRTLGQLTWPLLATVAVGVVFGATQTAIAAEYTAAGNPGLTGFVYGCVGVGSGVASLLIVRVKWLPLAVRIALGGGVVAIAAVGLRFAERPAVEGVLALLVGAGVGIVIVSALLRIEQCAPPERINWAMTLGATGVTLGVSVGAATAGQLVTDPGRGFWPTIVAGVAALLIGLLMRRPALRPSRFVPSTAS